MKLLIPLALIAGLSLFGQNVNRAAVFQMEKSFDNRLQRGLKQEPFELLGNTRGLYLDGYGAVFTAEVNLVFTPVPNPFRPPLTKEEIAAVHERKLKNLPLLRETMREMLLAASASLDGVGPDEQIVVGMNLFYMTWEDKSGLPRQIVFQAQRQKLVEIATGRVARSDLDRVVKTRES